MGYNSLHLATLLKKVDKLCHDYDVIGLELKDRRIALSKTLASLSDNLCSISYISKIENCKIEANKVLLREICHRLSLDDSQIDVLFDLKTILENVVSSFIDDDYETIKKEYEKVKGLCNYRYSILQMIYLISINDFVNANKVMLELMKIACSMYDYDLVVFSSFSAIIQYYNQNYLEAKEIIIALRMHRPDNDISLLIDKYYFLSLVALNEIGCVFEFERLRGKLVNRGYYSQLDYVNYVLCIYLYRNKEYRMYKDVYKAIKNRQYRFSLIYQLRDSIGINIKLDEKFISELDDKTKLLYYINTDKKGAYNYLTMAKSFPLSFDFNHFYLRYRLLENDEERYIYLSKNILPRIEMTKEGYWCDYFLKELATLSDRVGKYKLFTSAYKALAM